MKYLDRTARFIADGKPFRYVAHPNADHGLRDARRGEGIDHWTDLRWFEEEVR